MKAGVFLERAQKWSESGTQLIEAGIRGLPFYTFLVFQQDWTENDSYWQIFIFIYLGKCAVLLVHAFAKSVNMAQIYVFS